MKMRLKPGQKLFQLFLMMVLCTVIFLFRGRVFADGTETWYTDFSLLSGSQLATEGTTGIFQFSMVNHSLQDISGDFYFVDAVQILSGVYACKSNTEDEVFGQYLSMENPTFDLQPGSGMIGTVSFDFPDHYSGVFYGCLVYSANIGDDTVNMSSRKALPLNISLNAAKVKVKMVANLGSRGNAVTGNNNGFQSKGKLLFYYPDTHGSPIEAGYVTLDEGGHGDFSGEVLAGCYDIVYKGWHHLSTYITDICINEGDELNFVTNMSLSGYGLFATGLEVNGGLAFQIAGDMPNTSGHYDFLINGTDLSVLYYSGVCPYLTRVSEYNICDLNNDGRVDSSDASVIIANTDIKDKIYYATDGTSLFTGFGTVDYFNQ